MIKKSKYTSSNKLMGVSEVFYDVFMFPFETLRLKRIRKSLMSKAVGKALEIGAGTGVNFKYYLHARLSHLSIIDIKLSEKVKGHIFPEKLDIHYYEGHTEKLPFHDNTFDTVVFTLVFCTVEEPEKGLLEIYRVLKPGGKILFIEHVLPENRHMKKLFNSVNARWNAMASGCNINRETMVTIKKAGFKIEQSQRFFKSTFISGVGIKV